VIAPQRVAPQPTPPQRTPPEPRRLERVRHATKRRTRRSRRRLHRPVFAVVTLACIVLGAMLLYVGLQARVTSLNFALSRAERERTAVLDDTQRLEDRIARLQSPERLAALAVKLKLHDPHVYAVVRIPEPKAQPRPTGSALAFFGAWLSNSGVK
jgi:cell division protein FtsB